MYRRNLLIVHRYNSLLCPITDVYFCRQDLLTLHGYSLYLPCITDVNLSRRELLIMHAWIKCILLMS